MIIIILSNIYVTLKKDLNWQKLIKPTELEFSDLNSTHTVSQKIDKTSFTYSITVCSGSNDPFYTYTVCPGSSDPT